MSFLFTKTVEQNFITHAMAYAACIGPYQTEACKNNRGYLYPAKSSSFSSFDYNILLFIVTVLNVLIE